MVSGNDPSQSPEDVTLKIRYLSREIQTYPPRCDGTTFQSCPDNESELQMFTYCESAAVYGVRTLGLLLLE